MEKLPERPKPCGVIRGLPGTCISYTLVDITERWKPCGASPNLSGISFKSRPYLIRERLISLDHRIGLSGIFI